MNRCLVVLVVLALQNFSARAANDLSLANYSSLTNNLSWTNCLSLTNFALPKIRLWNLDASLRTSVGYRANPTYSSLATNSQDAPFWAAGGDLLVFRLPTGGWQFSSFLSYDYLSYVRLGGARDTSREQQGMAMAQLSKQLGGDWKTGVSVCSIYQDQVVDTGIIQTNGSSISEILGENVTARWFVRDDFKPWWTECDLSGTRQWLAAPLDGFWEPCLRLAAGRGYGSGGDLSLWYQWAHLGFDTREQVTADDYAEPGTHLGFQSHSTELQWQQMWDERKRWQTLTRAGFDYNLDNGSGYFNYWQYHLSEQLKYQAKTWEVSASAAGRYCAFPVQPASETDLSHHRKTVVSAEVCGRKKLGKSFTIFARFAYGCSLSNASYDNYATSTTTAGLEYRF